MQIGGNGNACLVSSSWASNTSLHGCFFISFAVWFFFISRPAQKMKDAFFIQLCALVHWDLRINLWSRWNVIEVVSTGCAKRKKNTMCSIQSYTLYDEVRFPSYHVNSLTNERIEANRFEAKLAHERSTAISVPRSIRYKSRWSFLFFSRARSRIQLPREGA